MSLPLSGIRILAVEQYGAGPFGTQHLADMGAEIIKIENPKTNGEVGRRIGPHFLDPNDSYFYESFNRNKKSITLDLQSSTGRDIFTNLVTTADAVFDNLRGDLASRLGLTYEALSAHNKKIVACHLSAYGRNNERATWPGYDYLMQAEAGYLSLTGDPSGPPERMGLSIVDYMTGTTAALGLLAALLDARTTGVGRDVDVSLFAVAAHNLNYVATWYMNCNAETSRQPRSGHPSLVPSQLYKTQDGWLFIMCNKPKFWDVLVELLGSPETLVSPKYSTYEGRLHNRLALTEDLEAILTQSPTHYWAERFAGKVPVAPVNTVSEALESPFMQPFIVSAKHPNQSTPLKTMACPISFSGTTPPNEVAPALGIDNEEILKSLGYATDDLIRFKHDNII